MRRSDAKPAPSPWYGKSLLRVGDRTVRPELNLLEHDGQTIKLEPLAMDLLVYLAGRAGEVVTAEEVMSQVWCDRIVEDSALYKRINQLRKALGDDAHAPSYIETVPKRGYRLIAPVSLQTPESVNPLPTIGPFNHRAKPRGLRALRVGAERILPAVLLAAIALVVVVAAVETRGPGSQSALGTRISVSSRPSVLLRPWTT